METVSDFQGSEFLDLCGKFMNGKFHWLQRDRISSIDLANEKWAVIEKPCNFKGGRNSVMLGVLRSDLSVFCNYLMSLASPCRADIWVMKEYGVKESWTKMFTVISPDVMSQMRVPPILMSNGDIFLQFGLHLGKYNSKDDSNRYVDVTNFFPCLGKYNSKDDSIRYLDVTNFVPFMDAEIYIKSLVCPFLPKGPHMQ